MTALIWVLTASSVNEKDTVLSAEAPGAIFPDIDLSTYYHEKRAGRLVLDPMCIFFFLCRYAVPTTGFTREAHIEFGDEVTSRLKLSPDGKTILWPQPTNDPEGLRMFVCAFNLHGGY